MKTAIDKSSKIAQMKYVVQCYISDMTGASVRVKDFTYQQLELAFENACRFYNGILPVPDNGLYFDYTV